MPIDSRIPLGIEPPKFDNPLDLYSKVAQVQAFQSKNKLADLLLQDKQDSIDKKNRLAQLWTDAGGDPTKAADAMGRAGYGGEAMDVRKAVLDNQKNQTDVDAKNFDLLTKRTAWSKQNLGELITDPGLSYQSIIDRVATGLHSGILDEKAVNVILSGLPRTNDQKQLQDYLTRSLTSTLSAEKQYKAALPQIEMKDTGGSLVGIQSNPAMPDYGKPVDGTEIKKTQSPDSKATTGLGYARLDFEKGKDAREQAGAVGGIKAPAGYRYNADGTLAYIPGGPADPTNKNSGAASEDERKAAGWYSQASNAFENMKKVMYDGSGKLDMSVIKPGILENTEAALGMDQAANGRRSAKRQQFVQGASSLSEALLRAATGAGVNKEEARQKIEELTPQLTDQPEVIRQKLDAIPMYLDSLKSRAGRAAPKSEPAAPSSGSPTAGWSIVPVGE